MERFKEDIGGNYKLNVKGWVGVSNKGDITDRKWKKQVSFREEFHVIVAKWEIMWHEVVKMVNMKSNV